MPKFDLKRIESVKGKQAFYQLTIDDAPDFTNLKHGETENDRKTGVLDKYEQQLDKRYLKNLIQIYNTMNKVANNLHVPGEKYHECTGREKSDLDKDYEFKHGDLRVYAVKTEDGKVIILGGFKNSQKEDIRRMRSLKKLYLKNLKSQKNEKR